MGISHNAVVLVVDKYSLPVHVGCGIAAVKYPVHFIGGKVYYTKEFFSILADLYNIREETSIFFYKRRIDDPPEERGFIGEWKAVSKAYDAYNSGAAILCGSASILDACTYCKSPRSELSEGKVICSTCKRNLEGHILPLRVDLKREDDFLYFLDDNTAYVDITDSGRLSTLIFRKIYGAGRERSVNPILPEEAEKLRRLLSRMRDEKRNSLFKTDCRCSMKGHGSEPIEKTSIYLDFERKYPIKGREHTHLFLENGSVIYETILELWFMDRISKDPQFIDQMGLGKREKLEWFGNQILYGIGGEKSDVLMLFLNEKDERYKAVVVELKKGKIDKKAISQARKYAYWIAQMVTAHADRYARPFYVKPVLIGHACANDIKDCDLRGNEFKIPYDPVLDVIVEKPSIYLYHADRNGINLHNFFPK